MDACLYGHIFESPITLIVQQAAEAIRRAAHQKEIRLPIAIVIEETGARARPDLNVTCARTLRNKNVWLRRKSHRNRRRHVDNRVQRQLRERIAALIAVARAERRSEMLGGDFLEARQMLPRCGCIALALKRARQPEFRRSMKTIQS